MESPLPPAFGLRDVTVVHADGRQEAGVSLVVRGGLIVAMGPGVEVPSDATLLEGDSLRVYPGLIDAQGKAPLRLPELARPEGVLPWNAPRDLQGFMPHRLAAWYLTGTGADGKEARNAGVVAAGVHPSGGMAPGQGAVVLFRKDARTAWETVAKPSLGLLFTFEGARGVYPGTLFAVIAQFRQMFMDAARQGLIESEYARSPDGLAPPAWDPDFEALRRAAAGELPVYFVANSAGDIRRVLGLADEIGFRPVIVGGEEAWKVADQLRARGVPVLVSVSFPTPREWKPAQGQDTTAAAASQEMEPGAAREKERLENAYANPGRLAAAGVTLALTSGGGGGDFRAGVAKAVAYGLPEAVALRAVTSTPAGLLGIPHLATLSQGRSATFVVTDGPIFGEGTAIRWTFVDGRAEAGKPIAGAGSGSGPGATVAGSWELRVSSQGMEIPFAMSLTQEGASFSGTMSSPERGAEARVENGRVAGSSITFTLVVAMGPESMVLDARGTVEGDQLTGSGSGAMGEFTFIATRKPGSEGGVR
jgi:imidazolonepropionase-like amidohydrolase